MTTTDRCEHILAQLAPFGVETLAHGDGTLAAHLRGTYRLLADWDVPSEVCEAGLCHSVYGTESFQQPAVSLTLRPVLQALIGREAERLTYVFGAFRKDSLWQNLDREEGFHVVDRHNGEPIPLSRQDWSDLLTLVLANWLEQRPRAGAEYARYREAELVRARAWLPTAAYEAFRQAYALPLEPA